MSNDQDRITRDEMQADDWEYSGLLHTLAPVLYEADGHYRVGWEGESDRSKAHYRKMAAAAAKVLQDDLRTLRAAIDNQKDLINRAQRVLQMYLEPGERRIQSTHATVNALISIFDGPQQRKTDRTVGTAMGAIFATPPYQAWPTFIYRMKLTADFGEFEVTGSKESLKQLFRVWRNAGVIYIDTPEERDG